MESVGRLVAGTACWWMTAWEKRSAGERTVYMSAGEWVLGAVVGFQDRLVLWIDIRKPAVLNVCET